MTVISGCLCRERHEPRRIVLTGGPGAGKTAVLEMLRLTLCEHAGIVREAATVVFGGGFPRDANERSRRAAQRAIYHVQLELEEAAASLDVPLQLCDRGVVDGLAYWVGSDTLWEAVGSRHADALARYDAVIHLRVPGGSTGYSWTNPLRIESADEARRVDDRILEAWQEHPRRHVIEATNDFMEKARLALAAVRGELPACCRRHVDETSRQQEIPRVQTS